MKKLIYIFIAVALFVSCSSIDCPMNSHVYATYGFYTTENNPVSLSGMVSVSTSRMDGNDTVLVNRQQNAHVLNLPLSYCNDADTLSFTFEFENGMKYTDRLYVEKTNDMHFESVECGANYFHTLKSVSSTNNFIDSVRIINKDVNYDVTYEHVYIYLKH